MGLEATVVCVDNSDWMRNGDFIPTRMQAQQDAVNVVCRMKTRQNVENTVGLLSLADTQVHVTLTSDQNKIFKALQLLEPKGAVNFITSIRIAHLALKHRQNKNQKMKIVAFIGSPITTPEKELIKLAKRLKKEKVTIDIVNFGEPDENTEKLTKFIETINGKDRTSHLVTAHPGPLLSDILLSSPILTDEEGAPLAPLGQGFEFGIDPTEDPELAMALRVSMEEQRQRQEEEVRRAAQESTEQPKPADTGMAVDQSAGGILAQANAAELPYNPEFSGMPPPSSSELSEEQELALALQMSLQGAGMETMSGLLEQAMETDSSTVVTDGAEGQSSGSAADKTEGATGGEDTDHMEEEMKELMKNKEFLQSVLSTLPGVNPEQALLNLQEMTEASAHEEGEQGDDKMEEEKSENKADKK